MNCKNIIVKMLMAILLVGGVSSPSSAQHPLSTVFTISRHHFVDTVKVKMWEGAIIVPVEIDGRTRNLMFDSGADMGFWYGSCPD